MTCEAKELHGQMKQRMRSIWFVGLHASVCYMIMASISGFGWLESLGDFAFGVRSLSCPVQQVYTIWNLAARSVFPEDRTHARVRQSASPNLSLHNVVANRLTLRTSAGSVQLPLGADITHYTYIFMYMILVFIYLLFIYICIYKYTHMYMSRYIYIMSCIDAQPQVPAKDKYGYPLSKALKNAYGKAGPGQGPSP